VPELNLVINGDCSGATTAIQNTRAATESMRGLSVMIPVQVGGSAGARNELGRVGAARDAAGGVVALGVDTSGLDAGRGALSDFRGEFQAANRDFASVGGVRSFGLSDDGSVRQLSGDVRALGSGLGATEGTFGRFASSATQSLGQADAGVALLDRSLGGVSAGLDGAAGGLDDLGAGAVSSFRNVRAEVKALADDLAGGGSGGGVSVASALDVVNKARTGVGAPRGPGASAGGVTGGGAGGSGGGSGGSGRGPTPPRGSGLGGAAGGGREGDGRGGLSGIGMPLLVATAVGGLADVVAAGAGVLSMAADIKAVPSLMAAANQATHEFNQGLSSTAKAATDAAPAIKALGPALREAGSAFGALGVQAMPAVLAAAPALIAGATTAMQALTPAVAPAVAGIANIGQAFLTGVASPASVNGIKALTAALADPRNEQGLANLTTSVTDGALGMTTVVAKAVTDVAGSLGSLLPASAGPEADAGLTGALSGGYVGAKMGGAKGGLVGALLGGAGSAVTTYEQAHGQDTTPTVLGEAGGAALGGLAGGAPGAFLGGVLGGAVGAVESMGDPGGRMLHTGMGALRAGGDYLGQLGAFTLQDVPRDAGSAMRGDWSGWQRDSAALGRSGNQVDRAWSRAITPGGADQPDTAPTAADLQRAAPHGYDQDPTTHALTPSAGPGGGGGVFAGGPGATQLRPTPPIPTPTPLPQGVGDADRIAAQIRGPVPPSSPGATGGFGQGAPSLPSAQMLQQLNAPTTQLSASMSQLGQNTAATAPPLSQVTQHATAAASSVTQLSQNSAAAMEPLKSIAPTASQGLASASKAISASSASLGQSVPAAMASGIDSNQGAACDAANQMGKSAVNCGAAALNAASPSKEFVELGVGIPQGLAIGVRSSAGEATGAVSSAMSAVVSSGAAGLAAASPSRAFTQLGQQMGRDAVNGVATGAATQSGNATQQLNNTLGGMTAANMPQQRQGTVQRQADQGQQDQQQTPAQREDAKIRAGLAGRGWSDSTQDTVAKQIEARGKNLDAASARGNAAQLDAMRRAGFRGLAPTGTGDGESPLSPLQQFGQKETDLHKSAQADALARLRGNPTSQQAAQEAQNRALGAGATNAPIPATARLLPQSIQQQAAQQGQQVGQNLTQGVQQGVNQGAPAAADAGGQMAQGVVNEVKKKAGTNSPSTITAQVGADVAAGLTGGLGAGLTDASSAIAPIASNSGLMVGYIYGRSVISGVDSVIKSADFQTAAVSGIGSQLAETALGQLGMLGPAGAGGSIYKTSAVTLGSVTPTVNVGSIVAQFGNQTISAISQQVFDVNMETLNNTIRLQ
jgi:hypothetical protein